MTDDQPTPPQLRVLIRTDASPSVGTGHLVRCLNLATELRDAGAVVTLACAEVSPASEAICHARGFRATALFDSGKRSACGPGKRMTEGEQTEDAGLCARLASGRPFDWAVVDHYGLDAAWERRVRRLSRQVMAIDDLADRAHDCDLLLDQNLRVDGGQAYDTRLPTGCERLVGPRFALLDGSFAAARSTLSTQTRDRILVSFGGSDPQSMTVPVLRALQRTFGEKQGIDVVIGQMQREGDTMRGLDVETPAVRVHYATRNMAGLMSRARLFVGAGGTTNWERCCLGLPGVVVSAADNQVAPCLALHDAGGHVYLGGVSEVAPETMAEAASAVLASPGWWQRMAERCSDLVDGQGAQRVSWRLHSGPMQMRAATPEDEEKVLRWRNDPAVRRFSGSSATITPQEHTIWYARTLGDSNCQLLIGSDARGDAGVVRYDVAQDVAKVSIYVKPQRLGTGTGHALLAAGERWLAARRPSVTAISADVHADNRASARLFADAGYRVRTSGYVRSLVRRSPA
jgi:UDP-2,4-diacetamido-2,4,6-trideoxy-beta-L-altropyranose hydrolase